MSRVSQDKGKIKLKQNMQLPVILYRNCHQGNFNMGGIAKYSN